MRPQKGSCPVAGGVTMKVALTLFSHPLLPPITGEPRRRPWDTSIIISHPGCGEVSPCRTEAVVPWAYYHASESWNYSTNGPHSQSSVWDGDLQVTQSSNQCCPFLLGFYWVFLSQQTLYGSGTMQRLPIPSCCLQEKFNLASHKMLSAQFFLFLCGKVLLARPRKRMKLWPCSHNPTVSFQHFSPHRWESWRWDQKIPSWSP